MMHIAGFRRPFYAILGAYIVAMRYFPIRRFDQRGKGVLKNLFIATFIVFSSFSCSAGETTNSLLAKSRKAEQSTSYKATMVSMSPKYPQRETYYHRANPDGTLDRLTEYTSGNRIIRNAKGVFFVPHGADTIIKMAYMEVDASEIPEPAKRTSVIKKDENTIVVDGNEIKREYLSEDVWKEVENLWRISNLPSPDISPAAKEVVFDGNPCYLVRYTYKTASGDCVCEKIIDKKTFLTRKSSLYNDSQGKVISSAVYTDIAINPVFAEGIFKLPVDVGVVVANSSSDLSRYLFDIIRRRTPSREGTQSQTFWNKLTEWVSGVFAEIFSFVLNSKILVYYLILQGAIIAAYLLYKKYRRTE